MSVILISLLAFLFLTAAAVGILLLVFIRSRSFPQATNPIAETPKNVPTEPRLRFRILDISLPLVVLILSVACTIILFNQIPTQVAYHFNKAGAGDQWLSRGLLITSMLLPQFLLTFLSTGIAIAMVKVGGGFIRAGKAKASTVRDVISLMSNMIVLPQSILFFAMLDIYLYNAYQIHLIPLYLTAILIMFIGSIAMGFFFFRQIRRFRAS